LSKVNISRYASIALFVLLVAAVLSLGLRARASSAPICQILNLTPMAFGGYAAGTRAPMDSMGEMELSCSAQTPVRILFGPSASGREVPREMRSSRGSLMYNLFVDAAHAVPWGDGTQGAESYTVLVIGGQPLRLPIFGRVFGNQAIAAGTYTDRVVVTLMF
jgi:spore coat protein U-like protein